MVTTSGLKEGQLVRSLKGRDKDHYFVVLKIIDKSYLLLVDGDLRKLAKPKKKKVQHVQILNQGVNLQIEEELKDSTIRKLLKPLNEPRRV